MTKDFSGNLNLDGERITPARRAMVDMFVGGVKPVSVLDILSKLTGQSVFVNKTTVYRELKFLMKKGIIRKINLGVGKEYFESNLLDHHHHLVCRNCRNILKVESEKVEMDIKELVMQTKTQQGFSIEDHNLEFFGVCSSCL